ncbi:MAG: ABC transporter ATP-binding protein [Thermodesulfobacteriota bacterium]
MIEVRDVYKSFKTVQAVRGISLSVFEGQFTALLGPNGAGKTTLVEMIEGIQKPDRGDIFILGKQWKGNEDELHRIIGLSLQETHFIDKLTVRETLVLFAAFYDLGKNRVAEIIDTIGLGEKRHAYVVSLSGGQRQRLALGIALLNRPKILLLDEPTTGLDPNARREIWSILFRLKEQGQTSLILTTHYMEEAEQLCDYIVIIDQGRILKQGPLDHLLNDDPDEKRIEFTLEKSEKASAMLGDGLPLPLKWDSRTGKGTVMVSRLETEIPVFLSFLKEKNVRLNKLEFRKKTLDDVFTSLTGRRLDE